MVRSLAGGSGKEMAIDWRSRKERTRVGKREPMTGRLKAFSKEIGRDWSMAMKKEIKKALPMALPRGWLTG